jgi:hypothetical protein
MVVMVVTRSSKLRNIENLHGEFGIEGLVMYAATPGKLKAHRE